MDNPQILRHENYEHPSVKNVTGYVGFVEPAGPEPGWVLFYRADGSALLFAARGPDGGVLTEPVELPAQALGATKPPPPILPPPFQE